MNKWTAYVEQEGDDLILPFPQDLLDQMGWKEGDVLIWDINKETGQVTLRKKLVWYKQLWSTLWKKCSDSWKRFVVKG